MSPAARSILGPSHGAANGAATRLRAPPASPTVGDLYRSVRQALWLTRAVCVLAVVVVGVPGLLLLELTREYPRGVELFFSYGPSAVGVITVAVWLVRRRARREGGRGGA